MASWLVTSYYTLSLLPQLANFYFLIGYNYNTFYVQPHPIQFTREPNDHFIFTGTDVTFVCSLVMFNGFIETSWFFNNTILKTGLHYNISSMGQGTTTLTIKNITAQDQGEYYCCVSDWMTKIRSRSGQLHGK